jgi:Rrf2 family iron-sulfur cluster assembly transcriptional regulator
MPLVPRKGVLAIAAVIDVAVNARSRPVSAKALASRNMLPPRHLEPVLQALVRDGILKGIRGPHGGYEIAREHEKITAEDILRSAGSVDEGEPELPASPILNHVVHPALAQAEHLFSAALRGVTLADMTRRAATATVHDLDSFDAIPVEAKVR